MNGCSRFSRGHAHMQFNSLSQATPTRRKKDLCWTDEISRHEIRLQSPNFSQLFHSSCCGVTAHSNATCIFCCSCVCYDLTCDLSRKLWCCYRYLCDLVCSPFLQTLKLTNLFQVINAFCLNYTAARRKRA